VRVCVRVCVRVRLCACSSSSLRVDVSRVDLCGVAEVATLKVDCFESFLKKGRAMNPPPITCICRQIATLGDCTT